MDRTGGGLLMPEDITRKEWRELVLVITLYQIRQAGPCQQTLWIRRAAFGSTELHLTFLTLYVVVIQPPIRSGLSLRISPLRCFLSEELRLAHRCLRLCQKISGDQFQELILMEEEEPQSLETY